MKLVIQLLLVIVSLAAGAAHAQFGVPWRTVPTVTVISTEADPRLALVDEALAFWNTALEEIGSGLRLGRVTRVVQAVPEQALQSLSQSVLNGRGVSQIPPTLRGLTGDLTILLGESEFISFAGPFDADGKRVVGIRGANFAPMHLPNVARNVITHEVGHALGLGHNSDPATLMCGRPAECRPNVFASRVPRMFALTDEEKQQLRRMYPPDWKPQQAR